MLKNSSSKYKNSPTCRSKLHKSTPYDFIPNLLKSYNSFAWRTAIETICRWVNNQFISGWTCPSTFMLHLVTAGLRAGHCGIFFSFFFFKMAECSEKWCTFIIEKSHLCMRKRGFARATLTFTLSLRLVRGSFLYLHRPECLHSSSETLSVRLNSAVSLRMRFFLCRLLLLEGLSQELRRSLIYGLSSAACLTGKVIER